jgi:hypothetical protein
MHSYAWRLPVCTVLTAPLMERLVYWLTGRVPRTFVAWYWGWCT